MKSGEWSRSRYWLCYFLHNRHTRVKVDPSAASGSGDPLAPALGRLSATSLATAGANRRTAERAAAECGDDPAFVQSLRLFVKEQQYHATIMHDLAQDRPRPSLAWRITFALIEGLRRLLTLRFELAVLMLHQVVAMALCRMVAAAVSDANVRTIIEQIQRDVQGHLAFQGERLTTEFADFNFIRRNLRRYRLRFMCAIALFLAAVQYRRLIRTAGWSTVAFLREGWSTFSNLLERVVPYRRDVLLRRLVHLRDNPYDAPTM